MSRRPPIDPIEDLTKRTQAILTEWARVLGPVKDRAKVERGAAIATIECVDAMLTSAADLARAATLYAEAHGNRQLT